MNFDDFQRASGEIAAKGPGGVERFQWCSKGLIESSGKIDRSLLNCSFEGESLLTEEKTQEISKELGFMLWFCSVLADALDKRLNDIAAEHLQRMQNNLRDRNQT